MLLYILEIIGIVIEKQDVAGFKFRGNHSYRGG